MGLTRSAWTAIVRYLQVPHFSHTKRLHLTLQKEFPVIYQEGGLEPQLPLTVHLWVSGTPDEPLERLDWSRCLGCGEQDSMRYCERRDINQCQECGTEQIYHPDVNYKRDSRKLVMARQFSREFYKRGVHFRFWLRRLQGKENHHVPFAVMEEIRQLFVHDNQREVHYWNVRDALKRLGHSQYYDNTISIMARLRGTPLAWLTPNQEQLLEQMFMTLQKPFEELEGQRVNMLSYPYVIRKLCEIRGWWKMAKVIPTLKSPGRIIMQDMAWRKICMVSGWPFMPTPLWTAQETRSPNHTLYGVGRASVNAALLSRPPGTW